MIKYRLHRYFGSNRPVVPVILVVCFLRFVYSIKPMSVGTGAVLSGIFQFVMMTFLTLNLNGSEVIVEEQLLLFHGNGWRTYFVARETSLLLISAFYALLHTIGPIVINACNGFSFFITPLTAQDVALGALVILGNGMAGIVLGEALHPRILSNRKLALTGAVVMMLLTIVKDALIEKCRFFVFLHVFLPAVMKPAGDLGDKPCLAPVPTLVFFCMIAAYYVVFTTIKDLILMRRKF